MLKKAAIECASHTSLKGVARILKSDSVILKGLWLIGVVLFLTICGYQCYVIMEEYFSYPVLTTISDKNVKFEGENAHAFPSIEVCNLSPFSSEAKNTADILSVEEYLKLFNQARMEIMNKTDSHPGLNNSDIFQIWNSPEGYINYLGYNQAKRLGHQSDIFIAKCTVIKYAGSALYHEKCQDNLIITTRSNGHFLQCTHIEAPKMNYLYGVSLVLYTDGFEDPFHFKDWGSYNIYNTGIDRASGASLSLHHPNADSIIQPADVVYINPGEMTDIRFKHQTITRLGKPYGICNMSDPNGTSKMYTQQSCMAYCQAYINLRYCHCVNTIVSFTSKEDRYNYPYCLSLEHGIEKVKNNINCMLWASDNEFGNCEETCQVPCVTHRYPTTITSTKWPKPSQHNAFYKSIIANKPYAWRFAELDIDCHSHTRNCTLEQIFRQQYLVENHFAKVNIILGDHRHTFITDHPQISFSSLLAKLGGALNLWSGITVVIIVEVIDFLLKLFLTKSENFSNSMK